MEARARSGRMEPASVATLEQVLAVRSLPARTCHHDMHLKAASLRLACKDHL